MAHITRAGLLDGTLLEAARSQASASFPILSDMEIEASLADALARRPDRGDVWVFGYGSLIWNPTIQYAEQRVAHLNGWHRRFCLASSGRGSSDRPGLMLALDKGGSCQGVVFRLEEARIQSELSLLWIREMLTGCYRAVWLTASADRDRINILTFIANHEHPRFIHNLSEAETVERIAFAKGPLGSNLEYFRNTIGALKTLSLRDSGLETLSVRVTDRLKQS